MEKAELRKIIARYNAKLNKAVGSDRAYFIECVANAKEKLAELIEIPGSDLVVNEIPECELPNFGKLKLVLEKEWKDEVEEFKNDYNQSDNDLKRLALKEAVYEYYLDLPYEVDVKVVDFGGAMVLRRDDNDIDGTDYDFAPNKSDIYKRWMDKLARYIRNGDLSEAEFDEASDRGIPQGGAFEKQLDRYRIDFMRRLWKEFEERNDEWKSLELKI